MKYVCPKCGISNPDSWCGGCGITIDEMKDELAEVIERVTGPYLINKHLREHIAEAVMAWVGEKIDMHKRRHHAVWCEINHHNETSIGECNCGVEDCNGLLTDVRRALGIK